MEAPGPGQRLGSPGEAAGRRATLLSCLLLAAAVLLVFGRSLGFPFLHWDDNTAVTENPLVHPPSWRNLATIWRAPWSGLYIPASFSVYWIEARLSGLLFGAGTLDPRVFRTGLLLLHFGCALLVLRILRRLVVDPRAACLGALLFALHPLQVESVAWITETRGVLATLFGLLALDVHVDGAGRTGGPGFLRHHLPSTAFLALAVLSKPTAAAVPLVAFLVDRFHFRLPFARILPLVGAWCLGVLLVVLVSRSQQSGAGLRYEVPFWARPVVALDALGFYLEKLAWPADLAADFGRKPAWLLAQPGAGLHALVPVGVAAVVALLPGRRTGLLALSIFAASLLPVLGFVSFDYQDISTVASRYTHLAMLAPAFALAVLLARAPARPEHLAAGLAAALVALLGVVSAREVLNWRDTEALFRRTLEVNPRSHIACVNLGVARAEAGSAEEAAAWYRRALELEPGYPVASGNLGRILIEEGKLDDAIGLLRETRRLHPDYPYAGQDLAIALVRRGLKGSGETQTEDFRDAELVLRDTLRNQPGFPGAHLTLAQLCYTTGRIREALEEFTRTLDLLSSSADAHAGIALCHQKLGNRELAEQHARAAAALRERR